MLENSLIDVPVGTKSGIRSRLSSALAKLAALGNPYKVGDYVVGDDPFHGRREGVITAVSGTSVGLVDTRSAERTCVYYDFRNIRKPE